MHDSPEQRERHVLRHGQPRRAERRHVAVEQFVRARRLRAPEQLHAWAARLRGGRARRATRWGAARTVNVAVNGLKPTQDRGYSKLPSA